MKKHKMKCKNEAFRLTKDRSFVQSFGTESVRQILLFQTNNDSSCVYYRVLCVTTHTVMKLLFLDESKLGRIFCSFFKDGINIPAMTFFDSSWCDSVSRYDSGHYIILGFIRVKTRVTSILWLIMTQCTESQPYIVTQIKTPIMTRTYLIILGFINGLIRVTTRHITALTLWTLPFRTQIMTHS